MHRITGRYLQARHGSMRLKGRKSSPVSDDELSLRSTDQIRHHSRFDCHAKVPAETSRHSFARIGRRVAIGATAGLAGDKWSLGFVAETEHQVVRHLTSHLDQISERDHKSRAILEQMKKDEGEHATVALNAGGAELPIPIKKFMSLSSKVMTKTVYHL